MPENIKSLQSIYLYLAWLIAMMSLVGSLFFSDLMKLPPCNLCWYQRIFMYPLVIVLWVGLSKNDRNVNWYALPIAIVGWIVAIYHNLLYYKIITPTITPCSSGVSCTDRQLDLLGFISIPLLSVVAFTVIIGLLYLNQKRSLK